MDLRRFAAALAGFWLACGQIAGCATTAPKTDTESSPSGPSYSGGRAMATFPATPGAVANATAEAMDDVKMVSVHRGRDGAAYQITARTADKRAVTVTIRPQLDRTRLTCRIGWFGDEPLTRTLLERIGIRLGTLPPAPIPDNPPSAPGSNPFIAREKYPDHETLEHMADTPYRDRAIP
jgi:hypothetical protein